MADVSMVCAEYDRLASERRYFLARLYDPATDPYVAALGELELTEVDRLIGVHDRWCLDCALPAEFEVIE